MGRLLACAMLLIAAWPGFARAEAPIVMREVLAIGQVGSGGRSPVITDAVRALAASGRWATPVEGDVLALASGHRKIWKSIEPNADGQFEHGLLYGGYAVWTLESDADRVMILDAAGHSAVWVNGVMRAGDLYEYGTLKIPVKLRKGANELLFLCGRGRLRAELREPAAPVYLDSGNVTLPHLLPEGAEDDGGSELGAVVIVNASESPARGLRIRCDETETAVAEVPALGLYKAPFRLPARTGEPGGSVEVRVELIAAGAPVDEEQITLRIATPDGPNVRTFRSRIDGSVQYYAERPATGEGQTVLLTLHGAGVEATGQAAVYAPKEWARVVAPTNRGKFGFDWEDWGRIDAMEVLDLVSPDRRAVLTGHSMGGHGSWQLAALFPDRFVAVGPSAGWVSFESYAGYPNLRAYGAAGRILERAAAPSDTLLMKRNFSSMPVYILHGSEDDNVPLEQAMIMKRELGGISPEMKIHSQLGAGHWWGNECCDWPEMMSFFRERVAGGAAPPDRVRFTTVNPGISARSAWATIDQQTEAFKPSTIDLTRKSDADRIEGQTTNCDRLTIDLGVFGGRSVTIVLDDDEVKVDAGVGRVALFLGRRGWEIDDAEHPEEKGPARNGPFKSAFDHDAVLVYATHGDEQENRWALERARHDSELFLARGNGALRVMRDDDYLASGHEGNVILYGHAQANSAWDAVLGEACPIRVQRGRIIVENQKTLEGDDLGAMFCYPVAGSNTRLAGVIAPTGPAAGEMLDRQLIFVSGVHYPDVFIMRAAALETGHEGIVSAGFFGNDWSIRRGDFVWTE